MFNLNVYVTQFLSYRQKFGIVLVIYQTFLSVLSGNVTGFM